MSRWCALYLLGCRTHIFIVLIGSKIHRQNNTPKPFKKQLSNRPATTSASEPSNLRFQLETNYYQPKDKYKSNLLNRVKLENKNRRTLIIKDGQYYQADSEPNGSRRSLRSSRTESIKRNNVLFCLSVLSPRKQDINLLNLRQAKYQPKRRNPDNLRRTQSEYTNRNRKLTKPIERQRRPSIEAELSSLANKSMAASGTDDDDGLPKDGLLLAGPNNNENSK